MRQFSAKQNQPAKNSSAAPASLKATPERTPAAKDACQTAVPRSGFDFGQIAVHHQTPIRIQPKLTVGAAADAFEQEADRVAEQVMRAPEPPTLSPARDAFAGHTSAPAARVQTKSLQVGDSGGIAAPPIVHDVLRSSGQPLDAATRAYMEPRFGHDFRKVRVHADAQAAEAASSIEARAFTASRSVVFSGGAYAPQTEAGRRLLAHELTHVVQQQGSPYLKDGMVYASGAYERQANIAGGQSLVQRQVISKQVEKQDDEEKKGAKEVSADYWLDIIPDAVARNKQKGVSLTKFSKREFSYSQAGKPTKKDKAGKAAKKQDKAGKANEKQDIAEADVLAEGITQADVDKAVAAIVVARSKILPRHMNTINVGGHGYQALKSDLDSGNAPVRPAIQGLIWTPGTVEADQKRFAEEQRAAEASRNYNQWIGNASPTRAKKAENIKDDPKLQKKLRIAGMIAKWEGDTSAINAYDSANVTWGWGFAASGRQAQQLTLEVFKQSPEARDAFLRAGIVVDAKKKGYEEYIVVDTDRKWKLHGKDAERYIRANKTLLSLMVDVAQGVLPEKPRQDEDGSGNKEPERDYLNFFGRTAARARKRDENPKADPAVAQAVLDANFETFLANTMNGSDKILEDEDWTVEQAALAAHAIHMTTKYYSWEEWAKLKPHNIEDIVEVIYTTTKGRFTEIVVPPAWRDSINKPKKPKVEKGKKEAAKK